MHDLTCAVCGSGFSTRHTSKRYCSGSCANRAKYERIKASGYEQVKRERVISKYRSDPDYRQKIRDRYTARQRALGVRPQVVDQPGTCQHCGQAYQGVPSQRYCSKVCGKRAGKARERQRGNPGRMEHILGAAVHDGERQAIRQVKVTMLPSGGMWVYCPTCTGMTRVRFGVDRAHQRWCDTCITTVELNEDEIRWLMEAMKIAA